MRLFWPFSRRRDTAGSCGHAVTGLAYCEACHTWLCTACFVRHVQAQALAEDCPSGGTL